MLSALCHRVPGAELNDVVQAVLLAAPEGSMLLLPLSRGRRQGAEHLAWAHTTRWRKAWDSLFMLLSVTLEGPKRMVLLSLLAFV